MASSNDERYRPSCMVAHRLINRLTVIVGYCDLLAAEARDSNCLKRLLQIRDIASSVAEELSQHECELEAIVASSSTQDALASSEADRAERVVGR